MNRLPLKIVVCGDGGVGKTTLINRFIYGHFDLNTKMTRGLDIHSKNVRVDGEKYKLILWDLGGQTQFKLIFPISNWLSGVDGALLLFDVSRYSTLLNLEYWLNLLLQYGDYPILLIGSKLDMVDGTFSSKHLLDVEEKVLEIRTYFPNCFKYLPTSAKTGKNVVRTFEVLSQKVVSIH